MEIVEVVSSEEDPEEGPEEDPEEDSEEDPEEEPEAQQPELDEEMLPVPEEDVEHAVESVEEGGPGWLVESEESSS